MLDLTAISIMGFITLGVYKLFELYVKKNERLLMIEKFASLCEYKEDSEERVKIRLPFISGEDSNLGFWPLRISLLLIGIGAGCLLSLLIITNTYNNSSIDSYVDWGRQFRDFIGLVNFASISFLGGIGLLAAFLIEQKMKAKKK